MNIEMTESGIVLQTDIINLRLKLLSAEDAENIFMLTQNNKLHLTQNGDYQDLINRDLQSTRFELSEPAENEESFESFYRRKSSEQPHLSNMNVASTDWVIG